MTIKDVGYAKRNKRCIPKEGMPHAQKACLKKRENWTHEGPSIQKKRRKEIAHVQRKMERDGS